MYVQNLTKHGLNLVCDEDACFDKSTIEAATDAVIDELIAKAPDKYSRSRIDKFLKADNGFHDIIVREKKVGDPGSCANASDPNRPCQGFECSSSPSGWCAGLHKVTIVNSISYSQIIFAKFAECISANAYHHELIHFFQYHIAGETDYDHETSPYWSTSCPSDDAECKKNTVENASSWTACELTCGDLCK